MAQRERSDDGTAPIETLRAALKSQYHASLAMLRAAIGAILTIYGPVAAVTPIHSGGSPITRSITRICISSQTNRVFRPWEHHQPGIHRFDLPMKTKRPYTKTEVLAYWKICDSIVDDAIDILNINSPQSGFSWYKIPKLEHQIVNIRHIQYHEAQLADRLRAATGVGVGWTDARRKRRESHARS